jgi:hypothetical protein
MTITEAILLSLADGCQTNDEIQSAVELKLKRPVNRGSLKSKVAMLRAAKLAVDGHKDDSHYNQIAHALMQGHGNREIAEELGVSAHMVATQRSTIRAVQAFRLPVDPTFHLQPSQDHLGQHLPEWRADRAMGMGPPTA